MASVNPGDALRRFLAVGLGDLALVSGERAHRLVRKRGSFERRETARGTASATLTLIN